jgi:hypothetical protein
MDRVKELENFYFKFGEERVNSYLIVKLRQYSLSGAIEETISYFNSL